MGRRCKHLRDSHSQIGRGERRGSCHHKVKWAIFTMDGSLGNKNLKQRLTPSGDLKIIFMMELWAREHQVSLLQNTESKKTPNSCYSEEMRQVEIPKQAEPKSCFCNKRESKLSWEGRGWMISKCILSIIRLPFTHFLIFFSQLKSSVWWTQLWEAITIPSAN